MNTQRISLIQEAKKQQTPFWERVAKDLAKSGTRRREVNLSHLSRVSEEGEVIVVPGKVLGSGEMTHKATVVAFSFSESAKKKLRASQCDSMSLDEFLKKNPKGSGRIIG